MILASYKNGPDGQLRIVSQDRKTSTRMTRASFQNMMDRGIGTPEGDAEALDLKRLHSPLPRAYQFLDGSAYVNHVELVRKARGAAMPDTFWIDPLMYQGGSDNFLTPTETVYADPAWGVDFEAEVAVVIARVDKGAGLDEARDAIRFVMVCNDWSLRNLIPGELAKGFGFVQSKPACAFSPFALSLDELPDWDGGKLDATMCVDLNGVPFGRVKAAQDMTFDFPRLISHAAKTRDLSAGTIIGSGTVSNKLDGGPGKTLADGGVGYSCIAEQRMVETIEGGAPCTEFMHSGDRVEIWMEDADGRDLFGRIDQKVEAL